MLINPKKLLRRERQLKAVIGMGAKNLKFYINNSIKYITKYNKKS